MLVSAASIAYIGPFFVEYRKTLKNKWINMCKGNKILIDKNY